MAEYGVLYGVEGTAKPHPAQHGVKRSSSSNITGLVGGCS